MWVASNGRSRRTLPVEGDAGGESDQEATFSITSCVIAPNTSLALGAADCAKARTPVSAVTRKRVVIEVTNYSSIVSIMRS